MRLLFVLLLSLLFPVSVTVLLAAEHNNSEVAEGEGYQRPANLDVALDLPEEETVRPAEGTIPTTAQKTEDISITGVLMRTMGGLLVVFILMLGLAFAWKKFGMRAPRAATGTHMELVETLSIGVKRSLSLVRVGDQMLVVGSGEHDLTLMTSMPTDQCPEIPAHIPDDIVDEDSVVAAPSSRNTVSAFKERLKQALGNGEQS